MLLTTTSTLEGMKIERYIGGRSATYEKELRKASDIAMQEMREEAQRLGANAVIGIDLNYEEISPGQGTMLMVSVSGTAVVIAN